MENVSASSSVVFADKALIVGLMILLANGMLNSPLALQHARGDVASISYR